MLRSLPVRRVPGMAARVTRHPKDRPRHRRRGETLPPQACMHYDAGCGQSGTHRFKSSHGPTRQYDPSGQSTVVVQTCGSWSQLTEFGTQCLPLSTSRPAQRQPSGQPGGSGVLHVEAQLPFARQLCPLGQPQLIRRPQSFAATPLHRRNSAQMRCRGRDLQRCVRLWTRARRRHVRRFAGSDRVRQRRRASCASASGARPKKVATAPSPPARAVRRVLTARVRVSNRSSSMCPPSSGAPSEVTAAAEIEARRGPSVCSGRGAPGIRVRHLSGSRAGREPDRQGQTRLPLGRSDAECRRGWPANRPRR